MVKDLATLVTSPAVALTEETTVDVAMELWEVFTPDGTHDPKLLQAALVRTKSALNSGAATKIHEGLTHKATRRDIAGAVAELIAAWPSAKSSDLQVFSRLAAEHIEAINPCRMALVSACSAIIGSKIFMPSVAEIRAAVQSKHDFYQARAGMLMRLPQRVIDVERELEAKP